MHHWLQTDSLSNLTEKAPYIKWILFKRRWEEIGKLLVQDDVTKLRERIIHLLSLTIIIVSTVSRVNPSQAYYVGSLSHCCQKGIMPNDAGLAQEADLFWDLALYSNLLDLVSFNIFLGQPPLIFVRLNPSKLVLCRITESALLRHKGIVPNNG